VRSAAVPGSQTRRAEHRAAEAITSAARARAIERMPQAGPSASNGDVVFDGHCGR
jgi:hypothetical protein